MNEKVIEATVEETVTAYDTALAVDDTAVNDESSKLSGKAIAVIGTLITAAAAAGGVLIKKGIDNRKAAKEEKERREEIVKLFDAGKLVKVEEPKQEEPQTEESVEVEIEPEPEKKETGKKK